MKLRQILDLSDILIQFLEKNFCINNVDRKKK